MPRLSNYLTARRLAVASGAALSLGILLAAQPAYAQFNWLENGIASFLANIVTWILQAVAWLTSLLIHVMIFVAQYNHFIDVGVVKTGWALVKDVSNMLFIVALLVIAVGTILRLENYRYNRLLGRVVVMAFLVNFSITIAGFFIQAGQVVMLTFVNAFKDAAFGNFASMFGLDKVLEIASSGPANLAQDLGVILVSLIAGLAMMVVAMVVMAAICVILVVRIIALWILIILSPLAFAMRIIPNTEKYYGQWWGEFTKYVTVGPVLAFFLWLALALQIGGSVLDTGGTFDVATYQKESGAISQFATDNLQFDVFTRFLISIVFLVMALQYATKSGVAGASFAAKVATTGFAIGAAATGLNFLRDRTVAPVQGFLQQRARRREEAIRDRTIALGARVDKAMTTGAIGQARKAAHVVTGAPKAAARVAVGVAKGRIEPGQALQAFGEAAGQRFEKGGRGYRTARQRVDEYDNAMIDRARKEHQIENMTGMQRSVLATSGTWYERAATEIERIRRGESALDDKDKTKRDAATAKLQKLFGGKENNMELRRTLIEAFTTAMSSSKMSKEGLQNIYSNFHPIKEVQMAAGERLLDPRFLDKDDQDDQRLLGNILETAERSGPAKLRDILKKGYSKIFDMMIEVHHQGLSSETQRERFMGAIESGEASESRLQRRHFTGPARIKDPATGTERLATDRERQDLATLNLRDMAKRMADMHRRRGDVEETGRGMTEEQKSDIYGSVELGDGWNDDDRGKFALATNQFHRAFRDAGGKLTAGYDSFVSRYADKMAENLSEAAVEDQDFMANLASHDNWYAGNFATIAKRNAVIRGKLTGTLKKVHAEQTDVTKGRKVDYKDKMQNKVRAGVFLGSWGRENLINVEDGGAAEEELAKVVAAAEGQQVSQIKESDGYKRSPANQATYHRIIGENLRYEQMPILATRDTALAKASAQATSGKLRQTYENDPRTANLFPLPPSTAPGPAAPPPPSPRTATPTSTFAPPTSSKSP